MFKDRPITKCMGEFIHPVAHATQTKHSGRKQDNQYNYPDGNKPITTVYIINSKSSFHSFGIFLLAHDDYPT